MTDKITEHDNVVTVEGKFGIKATVLKRSRSHGIHAAEFVTYEIEYPRIILAEFNTHRALGRNSSSSRAIPYMKMLEQLTARPVRFGAANPGMQDKGEDFDAVVIPPAWSPHEELNAAEAWEEAKYYAKAWAGAYYDAGYAKQIFNRLVEPFQMMKTIVSATEWENFFWLRDHDAADPTIAELARVMKVAYLCSKYQYLLPGDWHLPYIDTFIDDDKVMRYGDFYTNIGEMEHEYSLEDAIKISCARCAAVSFRNVDYDLEKSKAVYNRLIGEDRKHASAFEHCATPMQARKYGTGNEPDVNIIPFTHSWEKGISHMDRDGKLWSGNLRGFIQYRKLIDGENYTG